MNIDIDWLDETIPYYPDSKIKYWILCIACFRKPRYKDLFLLLCKLNKNNFKNEKTAKKIALIKVANLYLKINGKLPNGFNYDE